MRKPIIAILSAVFSLAGTLPAQHLDRNHELPSKSVIGTVTGFKVDDQMTAIVIKPDNIQPGSGAHSTVAFASETEVIRVAPGEHDLGKGENARITDIM